MPRRKEPSEPRFCKLCGVDISHRHGRAMQCEACAEQKQNEWQAKKEIEQRKLDGDPVDYPRPKDEDNWTIEDLLSQPWGFKIETITNVQRAIARVLDARPLGELAFDQDVIEMFGGTVPDTTVVPRELAILWAIRCAKSVLCVATAFKRSQAIDVSGMIDSDQIRIPILSTELDTATPTFQHLKITMTSTPWLKSFVVDEGKDFLLVRHPTGRHVEIKVVAIGKAGSTLVARYLPCVIFDEAPRMSSQKDHVKTLDDSLRAVRGRILPGGTIFLPGSPNEPVGYVHALYKKHFGKPTADVMVIKARGPTANPYWWTPEQIAYVKRREPKAYRTDCEADFLKPPNAFLDHRDLECVSRGDDALPPSTRSEYSAALVAGTASGKWVLLVEQHTGFRGDGLPEFAITMAREWSDTADDIVRAERVLANIKQILAPYGIDFLIVSEDTDAEIVDTAESIGLTLHPEELSTAESLELIGQVKTLIESGRYQIPANDDLKSDLLTIRKSTTNAGNTSIVMPESSDERRCDYIPALLRARKFATVPMNERANASEDYLERLARKLSVPHQHDERAILMLSGRSG